jgi:hypothetical protein
VNPASVINTIRPPAIAASNTVTRLIVGQYRQQASAGSDRCGHACPISIPPPRTASSVASATASYPPPPGYPHGGSQSPPPTCSIPYVAASTMRSMIPWSRRLKRSHLPIAPATTTVEAFAASTRSVTARASSIGCRSNQANRVCMPISPDHFPSIDIS